MDEELFAAVDAFVGVGARGYDGFLVAFVEPA
jgi:hypothetical protein